MKIFDFKLKPILKNFFEKYLNLFNNKNNF